MNSLLNTIAIGALVLATILVGLYGIRISRTTSDFFVASRTVRPWWNASAISGEYLSAGTFLGLSGLVLISGSQAFWFPIGYAAGYLLVLFFVAAPLRRSGAYTIPDFVEARLESRAARRVTSAVVLIIGWLYIVPQLHGAAITIEVATGIPPWVGAVLVAVVVSATVAAGGMRSITFVQAFQYWLKVTALAVPVVFLAFVLVGNHSSFDPATVFPAEHGPVSHDLYRTSSLLLALLLGTIGLPHVLVRFYTSPNGRSARSTTVLVIVMISIFYAVSSTMGLFARIFAPELAVAGRADTAVLVLPSIVFPGLGGELLTALVVAGAFAAFLATASGLVVSLAGVVSQDIFGGTVTSFRFSAIICTLVPLIIALFSVPASLVSSVGLVFVFAASALSPMLLLGVWWRPLTARGAVSGMVVGAALCAIAFLADFAVGISDSFWAAVVAQPAMWTIPIATGVSVVVSLLNPHGVPVRVDRFLARLHTPDPPARASTS